MPSAAAETIRKPREGKKGLSKHDFLLLDALWNDAPFIDQGWIAARPRRIETT
jgi:hypothetical protein